MDTLEKQLSQVIGDRVLSLDHALGPEEDLYAAGLDSMAIMQLLLVVEEEFGVCLPVESVSRKNLSSIRALADLLREKQTKIFVDFGVDINAGEAAAGTGSDQIEHSVASEASLSGQKEAFKSLSMQGADYFVLSFDKLSRKTGQGGHKAHSFLMLEGLPDPVRLRHVLSRCGEQYPMLSALLKRNWFFGNPFWVPSACPAAPEILFYSQQGSRNLLVPYGGEIFQDAHELMEKITNFPMPERRKGVWPKARFSLLELLDGNSVFVFSWSHLMLDGVGAELFLRELERSNIGCGDQIPAVQESEEKGLSSVGVSWQRAAPVVNFFRELSRTPITCLGPARPQAGKTHFLVRELTLEQTKSANARCAALCGDLVSMPFFLACAMRAHEAVFRRRGKSPVSQTCCVPVQTRRKGVVGPLFQNHITMFFGVLMREDNVSIEKATAAMMEQHSRFLRDKMGESLNELMHLMSFIPSRLYMAFMKLQMRGPFASFFHSHTGEFAPGLENFFGARIRSAFHVPGIGTPPGTGIFCNEKNNRLVVTMCWHEAALNAEERQLLMDSFLSNLGVA